MPFLVRVKACFFVYIMYTFCWVKAVLLTSNLKLRTSNPEPPTKVPFFDILDFITRWCCETPAVGKVCQGPPRKRQACLIL